MGKFLVRVTVVVIAIYFLLCYMLAQVCGIDILYNWYVILIELVLVVYCYSEGKYHCTFLKHTALGIFLADTITRLDYAFDFLSVTAHNLIPAAILCACLATYITKAIIHFHKVRKLKKQRNGYKDTVAHEKSSTRNS